MKFLLVRSLSLAAILLALAVAGASAQAGGAGNPSEAVRGLLGSFIGGS